MTLTLQFVRFFDDGLNEHAKRFVGGFDAAMMLIIDFLTSGCPVWVHPVHI